MELDLNKIKKVFFVGIGGIGISAIARMMLLDGKEVSGSDMAENEVARELEGIGVRIDIGQSFDFIPEDTDLIVYSIAVPDYDPKFFEQIKNSGIAYKSYPEMLSIVTADKYTIAISGTHGKTTTTAMLGGALVGAGLDPSMIVGALLKDKSNLVVGQSEYFVVEACEYERSFLNIHPKILIITNIEADHLDYYGDLAGVEQAFSEMVDQTDLAVVCNPADPSVSRVLKDKNLKVVDYMQYIDKLPKLSVPGDHNRQNAAAALVVADILGAPLDKAKGALSEFTGIWRRLEKKGQTDFGTIVYDDYAHHPTEIKASLSGLRELYPRGEKKITIVFQPHLYSRTKALFDDFIESFDLADEVVFLPIYFAREEPDPDVASSKLAAKIAEKGVKTVSFETFDQAEEHIKTLGLGSSDVLVTMGAGEAYKVAENTLVLSNK